MQEELNTIDLAAELMIPTEEKTVPVFKEPELKTESSSKENSESIATTPTSLAEVITPEDSAENLVTLIDAILGLAGGAFYAIKGSQILNKEEKEVYRVAIKKKPSDRTDDETFLIDRFLAAKVRLEEKSEAVDLTEKEASKLKKSAKAFVKMKNIKIGSEVAFYIVLADIVSDRLIDAFVD